LILVFLVSLPVLKLLGLPLVAFWDAGSVTLLTGMIFTKLGCFLNGCCGGRPTKSCLSLYLPDHRGIWRQRLPTQLLEAGLAAIILMGLAGLWNRLPFEGALFLYTVATYSLGRWWLETTRETIDRIGPWSLHRLLSAGFVVIAATVFLLKWILGSPAATMVY
jgi:prolipoprotein diacylglyceryltransferase